MVIVCRYPFLFFNKKGSVFMSKVFDKNEKTEAVIVNGYPFLFFNERIKEVPENMYKYEVRHDDDQQGYFAECKKNIFVNFWGTIIGFSPLPMNDGRYDCTDDDGLFFGFYGDLEEFKQLPDTL